MRALQSLAIVLLFVGTAAAQPRKVLVFPLDGNADTTLRTKLGESVQRLARTGGVDVSSGEMTFAEAASATGCDPTAPTCADTVLSTLGVDEIVYGTVTTRNGQTTVVVKRATKGSPPRETSATLQPQDSADKAEPALRALFAAPNATPIEPTTLERAPDEPPSVATTTTTEPVKAWRLGIAPRLGFVLPTSKLGAMVIGGIELDYVLPAANRQLVVALDLSLTRPSYDASVMDPRIPSGSAMYTIHETEMVIGATIGYRLFPADRVLVPWGAIGPVLHLLRTTETTTLAPGDNTATSTELGLELAGGADYRAGPGFLIGGARFVYSKLDHVLTGNTNAGKLGFEVGYRIVF